MDKKGTERRLKACEDYKTGPPFGYGEVRRVLKRSKILPLLTAQPFCPQYSSVGFSTRRGKYPKTHVHMT